MLVAQARQARGHGQMHTCTGTACYVPPRLTGHRQLGFLRYPLSCNTATGENARFVVKHKIRSPRQAKEAARGARCGASYTFETGRSVREYHLPRGSYVWTAARQFTSRRVRAKIRSE